MQSWRNFSHLFLSLKFVGKSYILKKAYVCDFLTHHCHVFNGAVIRMLLVFKLLQHFWIELLLLKEVS